MILGSVVWMWQDSTIPHFKLHSSFVDNSRILVSHYVTGLVSSGIKLIQIKFNNIYIYIY
jgi:hypothetical protein